MAGHGPAARAHRRSGGLIGVAGTLGLNANGNIDGELQMTVTGLERIVPALGIEKILQEGVPQATLDRGYALVQLADGAIVREPVPRESKLRIRVARGIIDAGTTSGP